MKSASRNDLVKYIQDQLGTTRVESRAALEAVLDGVVAHLQEGRRVSFSGFGSFAPYERGPLRRFDMNTGKTRTLDARQRVRFTPSPKLLDKLEDALNED